MHYQIRGEFRDWPFPDLTHLRLNNRLPNPDSKLKFLRRLSELVVSNFAGCLRI
ncbi:hypothetical protein BD410DRAFT_789325 [Rickenella mellea]|uniref:Uncharacterized protein n=1 Tax=Rickenella mellea TaxID=50990 RepID=A0A4Y7Q3R9_9AGAM|nr:hypothetical protein BD410DRAFT_789325 [Rickenella mellea]